MEILRTNQKEMLENKSTVTEMKTAIGGTISTLDMAEDRTRKLEYQPKETSQNEMQYIYYRYNGAEEIFKVITK